MGVFSIIAIVTIGNAAKAYMNSKFNQMGANLIEIKQKSKTLDENDWLRLDDIDTIKEIIPEVKDITALSQSFGTVRVGSKTRDAIIFGVTASYKNFRPLEIVEGGRFIIDDDEKAANNVVIVNETFARKYFNTEYAVGKTVELKVNDGTLVTPSIIGVMKREGNMFENFMGDDFPAMVYMPVTTLQQISASKKVEQLMITVSQKEELQDIGLIAVRALEYKHENKGGYTATNSADMQKTMSDVMKVIQWVLLVIAIITLIVGGIGIVNILLVSVTERIREIGVRKALGARNKDIVIQFLMEAMIMTGASGLAGILLGVIGGMIAAYAIKIPPALDIKIIIAAFTGSVLLGLIFGVYPAKRAAELDPIESLRYE
jgi:putative ABC transport system permease protein